MVGVVGLYLSQIAQCYETNLTVSVIGVKGEGGGVSNNSYFDIMIGSFDDFFNNPYS